MEPSSASRQATSEVVFRDAVCAVDGTDDSLSAVAQAAALVGAHGHLYLLLATSYRHEGDMRSPAISPAQASEVVERARAAAAAAGVDASIAVDPGGSPTELIVSAGSEHDLLALGAPATQSWFGSIFMESVTAAAEETLNSPLLISRPHDAWRDGVPPRILVASDGLDGSDGLLAFAGRLADAHGAQATVVHVLGVETRAHPHRVERQAADLGAALRVELGTPRNVIVEVARDVGAGLILMGSRRLAGMRALGSVSRPVAQHADCPVLLVPPEWLGAPAAA